MFFVLFAFLHFFLFLLFLFVVGSRIVRNVIFSLLSILLFIFLLLLRLDVNLVAFSWCLFRLGATFRANWRFWRFRFLSNNSTFFDVTTWGTFIRDARLLRSWSAFFFRQISFLGCRSRFFTGITLLNLLLFRVALFSGRSLFRVTRLFSLSVRMIRRRRAMFLFSWLGFPSCSRRPAIRCFARARLDCSGSGRFSFRWRIGIGGTMFFLTVVGFWGVILRLWWLLSGFKPILLLAFNCTIALISFATLFVTALLIPPLSLLGALAFLLTLTSKSSLAFLPIIFSAFSFTLTLPFTTLARSGPVN